MKLLTGTLRDAATLMADGVKHDMDVPALLRAAAKTIDDLRQADDGPQCDGAGWVRCGKCNGRLATYEPCESC